MVDVPADEEATGSEAGDIQAPHPHGAWLLELGGGKNIRDAAADFLWTRYRLPVKGCGKWFSSSVLDCWSCVQRILYCMKFPATTCGKSLNRGHGR